MQKTPQFATMIYLSGLVVFLLVLTAEARVGNSSQLSFCTETDECLVFRLICETDQYELRHYGAVKWVTTEETSFFMEFAAVKAFKRLFSYIDGANERNEKIKMTAPVVVTMPDKRFWQMGVYTMSFLLPSANQKNPPKPNDDKVYIKETPDMKVYVQSYGGWMTSGADSKYAYTLSNALDLFGAKYKKGEHQAAGYNSPMTFWNRHNEVWFVATDDEAECSSSEESD